jgi:hypothetical protein
MSIKVKEACYINDAIKTYNVYIVIVILHSSCVSAQFLHVHR